MVIARATHEGDTWYDPHLVESLTTSKPKAKEKAKTNATAETDAETKPKPKKKASPATKSPCKGKASKTDKLFKSEKKSGSGDENTKNTTKRKAKGKEDADAGADPLVSSDHSDSTGGESGESNKTE